MHDATMQGSPRKKFNKIRELNRRRNYFTKKVRNALRVGVAKALWDRRRRQPVDLSSAKTVLLMRNEGAVGDVVVDSALVKCLHQSGYIVDFLLTTSNSQVMRYNPRIRHIYEADPVTSADFLGNDSNLLIVFYVQIVPDDFVMQLHRFGERQGLPAQPCQMLSQIQVVSLNSLRVTLTDDVQFSLQT